MRDMHWHCRDHRFTFPRRALVLGILNVTPDSFSDGGTAFDPAHALNRAHQMLADGADLLDIGGESTRPGSDPVPPDEQLRRIGPVVAALARQTSVPLSIDTTSAVVARACLDFGASIINDVSGLRADPDMLPTVTAHHAGVIVMHMQGTPKTMQLAPHYAEVVQEVNSFFAERIATLTTAGMAPECIALDPGIGFGKTLDHNLTLLARLGDFLTHGRPVCLGVSRKGFLGKLTGRPVHERLAGSVTIAAQALARNAAQIIRAHDVSATRDCVILDEACHV